MSGPSPRRLAEVVEALMLEGLQVPLGRMRVTRCAGLRCRLHCTWERWMGRGASARPWPEAVRAALVRLGPAFVKVGQVLSVRSDLVPAELIEALHGLQSHVPPVAWEDLEPDLVRSLGGPLEETFAELNHEPLAAGSVAQVHRATLRTGEQVVLKLKRPGIDEIVAQDLDILVWLAEQAERHLPIARSWRVVAAARELQRYTLQELDFRNEARVAREVGQRFETWPTVRVPHIHHGSQDLIIMDFVEGFPIDEVESLAAHDIDRKALMRKGAEATLAQIFEFGLFHADPHPGNLHVTAAGELVLLDFGIFGRIDEGLRRQCALLMWTLSRGDVELASYFLLRMARLEPDADVGAFRAAVEACYRQWHGRSVSEYGFARLLYEELTIGARHGVIFPPDMVLLGKAMMTLEGVVLSVDPELDLAQVAEPYLSGLRGQLMSRDRLLDGLQRSWPLWWELLERLPLGLAELLERGVWPHAVGAEAPRDRASSSTLPAVGLLVSGSVLAAAALPPVAGGWSLPGAALVALGLVTLAASWWRP